MKGQCLYSEGTVNHGTNDNVTVAGREFPWKWPLGLTVASWAIWSGHQTCRPGGAQSSSVQAVITHCYHRQIDGGGSMETSLAGDPISPLVHRAFITNPAISLGGHQYSRHRQRQSSDLNPRSDTSPFQYVEI